MTQAQELLAQMITIATPVLDKTIAEAIHRQDNAGEIYMSITRHVLMSEISKGDLKKVAEVMGSSAISKLSMLLAIAVERLAKNDNNSNSLSFNE